jgi:inner membrane protein
MLPGSQIERYVSGLHVPVSVPETATVAFSLELPIHGSRRIQFAPLGVRNEVALRSSWPNPSFNGAFLPATRSVKDAGFTAAWSVSYYGRDFGQHGNGALPYGIDNALFGVELLPGIDSYRSVDRSLRYGILFVVLALMSFFMFEVIAKARIHPFQYAMVGVALAVFFLLLLALSELAPFAIAYAASAAGTVGLVTMYMVPVLRTGRRTLVATALLGASFGVLYTVLQAEDYALLTGSLVVFVALAVAMRLTRALDWYAEDESQPVTPRTSAS